MPSRVRSRRQAACFRRYSRLPGRSRISRSNTSIAAVWTLRPASQREIVLLPSRRSRARLLWVRARRSRSERSPRPREAGISAIGLDRAFAELPCLVNLQNYLPALGATQVRSVRDGDVVTVHREREATSPLAHRCPAGGARIVWQNARPSLDYGAPFMACLPGHSLPPPLRERRSQYSPGGG